MQVTRSHIVDFAYGKRKPTVPPLKVDIFICQCGCRETFFASYRTRRPLYKNKTHKQRVYRARKKAREAIKCN